MKHTGKTYHLTVVDTAEGLAVELPDELLLEAGWKLGDTLQWTQMPSGTWHLRKVPAS